MSQNVAFLSPNLRQRIVNSVAAGSNDGPTLSDLSVADLPEGALCFVVSLNALYRYKPRSTVAADTTSGYHNVVPSSGAGNWVRQNQLADATLVGGVATIVSKFDLTGGGTYFIQGLTNGGSVGVRVGVTTNATTATITSSSNTDTSTIKVQYVETLTA